MEEVKKSIVKFEMASKNTRTRVGEFTDEFRKNGELNTEYLEAIGSLGLTVKELKICFNKILGTLYLSNPSTKSNREQVLLSLINDSIDILEEFIKESPGKNIDRFTDLMSQTYEKLFGLKITSDNSLKYYEVDNSSIAELIDRFKIAKKLVWKNIESFSFLADKEDPEVTVTLLKKMYKHINGTFNHIEKCIDIVRNGTFNNIEKLNENLKELLVFSILALEFFIKDWSGQTVKNDTHLKALGDLITSLTDEVQKFLDNTNGLLLDESNGDAGKNLADLNKILKSLRIIKGRDEVTNDVLELIKKFESVLSPLINQISKTPITSLIFKTTKDLIRGILVDMGDLSKLENLPFDEICKSLNYLKMKVHNRLCEVYLTFVNYNIEVSGEEARGNIKPDEENMEEPSKIKSEVKLVLKTISTLNKNEKINSNVKVVKILNFFKDRLSHFIDKISNIGPEFDERNQMIDLMREVLSHMSDLSKLKDLEPKIISREISTLKNKVNPTLLIIDTVLLMFLPKEPFIDPHGLPESIRHLFGSEVFNVENILKKRSKKSNNSKESENVTKLSDLILSDKMKNEVIEIIELFKNSKSYKEIGARTPKGILLSGGPGLGKTMIAKAVAGETDSKFIAISGSSLSKKYVGEGAGAVRELFNEARNNQPSIIFIDEIDSIGCTRDSSEESIGRGSDPVTLNELLAQMDGFNSDHQILILAATNLENKLDEALVRPGRFDRKIEVTPPSPKEAMLLLKHYLGKVKCEDDIDFDIMSNYLHWETPASISTAVNEAAILAVRAKKQKVSTTELKEAFVRLNGIRSDDKARSEAYKNLIRYHETGHAVVELVLNGPDKISCINTNKESGDADGYVSYIPEEEEEPLHKEDILNRICVSMGGRAAEMVFVGKITPGAYSDLRSANKLARNLIIDYSMIDDLEFLGGFKELSPKSKELVEAKVREIVRAEQDRAVEILKNNSDKVALIVGALTEHPVIYQHQLKELLEGKSIKEIFK